MSQKSLTSLKKLKPTVLRGRDLEIETTNSDVQELQKQKLILLRDVKKLGDVYFGLKKAKDVAEQKFDDYATGRVMSLEYIAREVSDELKIRAEEISKQAKMVQDTRSALEASRVDLTKREDALGTRSGELDDRESSLAELNSKVDERQQGISQMQGKLGGKMSILSKKETEIDSLYEETQKMVDYFKEQADKERELLAKHRADLKRKEIEFKAVKVAVDLRDKDLTKRKTYIRNREAIVRMLIGHYGLDKDKIPKRFKK